jgi:MFS family permease
MNVTAGIGIIGMASPMLQEVFGGKLIGVDAAFNELSPAQLAAVAAIAAGFTGLLSLFNIAGRFIWASSSDYLGRKLTYCAFFGLGIVLYASAPWSSHLGSAALFVAGFCVILSMYGGGFATMPAYLADMFGTQMVGAIMGRLLTAWSAAGILGPLIVGYLRDYQLARNVPPQERRGRHTPQRGKHLCRRHWSAPYRACASARAGRRRARHRWSIPISAARHGGSLPRSGWLAACRPRRCRHRRSSHWPRPARRTTPRPARPASAARVAGAPARVRGLSHHQNHD